MRTLPITAALAAAALAAAAMAQEPASAGQGKSTLSGLSETVGELSDQTQAQAPTSDANVSPPVTGDRSTSAPTRSRSNAAAPAASRSAPASGPAGPVSAEQRAAMELAMARGRQLFAVARAGLLATQDMLSRVADPGAAGIAGWVAEPEGNAMAVTFYGNSESGPVAIYRARILGGRAVSRETYLTGDRPQLAGLSQRLARARSASESDDQRACTQQAFNVIAVPPEAPDGPIQVYRISAPESRSKLPLGGHYRSTVAAGGTVTEARSFTNGCLNVDVGEVPAGSQPGPIAVTHLKDDVPTEIHVFLSLFSGRPLVVAAGDPTRLFMVAGDSIREMRR